MNSTFTIRQQVILYATLFGLHFIAIGSAYSTPNLQALDALINHDPQAALQQLNALRSSYAGQTDFDRILAKAALKTGQYEQASFILKRLLIQNPQDQSIRFKLAFSYFQLNNLGAAQTETQTLLKIVSNDSPLYALSQTLHQRIERKQLNQQRVTQASLSLTTLYSSNVNSGIKQDSVYLPVLNSEILLDEGKQTEDTANELGFTWFRKQPITQNSQWSVYTQLSARHHHNEQQYDTHSALINLGLNQKRNQWTLSAKGYLQPMALDQRYYQLKYGTSVAVTTALRPKLAWSSQFDLGREDNQFNALQSAHYWHLATSLSHRNSSLTRFSIHYLTKSALQTEGASYAFNQGRAHLAWSRPLMPHVIGSLSASYAIKHYPQTHPVFLVSREDKSAHLSARIQTKLQSKLVTNLTLAGHLDWMRQTSNIELYTWDRTQVSIHLTYPF